MPRSRKQKHHAITHPHQYGEIKHKTRRSAALVMAIFIGALALTITAVASGMNYWWMITGAIGGSLAGVLIGHGIDRSIEKK